MNLNESIKFLKADSLENYGAIGKQNFLNNYKNSFLKTCSDDKNIFLEKRYVSDLPMFLKENFKLTKNFDEVYNYLMANMDLIGVLYKLTDLFEKEFPTCDLEINFVYEFNGPVLAVFVHTYMNGFEASDRLRNIENEIYENSYELFDRIFVSAIFH